MPPLNVLVGSMVRLASSVCAAEAPAAAPEAVVGAFHAALRTGDATAAARQLDESAVIFEQGGAERTKAQYVAAHLPADIAYAAATQDEAVRRTAAAAGDLAYVLTEGRTTGAYNGKAVNRITTETMVLRRFEDGWRIVHIHWSSGAGR
jgi:ketosteroid isomerase-like protein